MIVFPATMMVPKTNRPMGSIARFTVTVISFTMGYSFYLFAVCVFLLPNIILLYRFPIWG
jgi:hypothetical protein